ncbi:MAG TPA: ATP-dependent DNA ligase, partial [Acidimicrobiales bacterium]|nr:ATP-dependent DNA ligase [Acidimicrobiales bacterium]
MPKTEPVELAAAGRTVSITSPGKVFFPERGDTKLDLARYYLAVEGPLLATMGGRPLLMQRYPNGATGPNFFQKRVPEHHPDWLTTVEVSTPNGTTSDALVAADVAHVLWAVNQGCLGFHVWPNRAVALDVADELRIDLDPSPGVDLAMVREAAHEVRAYLGEQGIVGYAKTTGSRGIHIYVRCEPRWTSYDVRAAAVALARELERRHPALMTWQWWKEERGARVFIDYNQNAPHKTVFGAWCVRA